MLPSEKWFKSCANYLLIFNLPFRSHTVLRQACIHPPLQVIFLQFQLTFIDITFHYTTITGLSACLFCLTPAARRLDCEGRWCDCDVQGTWKLLSPIFVVCWLFCHTLVWCESVKQKSYSLLLFKTEGFCIFFMKQLIKNIVLQNVYSVVGSML